MNGKSNILSIYEEENFLNVTIGNFFDCIKNSVYNLQQYIDMFHNNLNVIYSEETGIQSQKVKQLLTFVIKEHENIIKYKGVAFANDVSNLLKRKRDAMSHIINSHKDTVTYNISLDACEFLESFQNELIQLEMSVYSKKTDENINITLNLINFMESEFDKFKGYHFNNIEMNCSKERILTVINNSYENLCISLTKLRITCANSTSIYYTALSCRKIISLMILLYHILSTIEINE